MEGVEKLWNDLRLLEGDSVVARTGVKFEKGVYFVPFLNMEIEVDPATRRFKLPDSISTDEELQHNHMTLAVLSFLVNGELREPEGTWITEKELPGGSLFFKGPHQMPLQPIIDKYGTDAKGFVERGKSLGGVESEYGDGSVEFAALPGLKICFVLWEADEEFSATCTIMFDKSFQRMLALDVVLGLASAVVEAITSAE